MQIMGSLELPGGIRDLPSQPEANRLNRTKLSNTLTSN